MTIVKYLLLIFLVSLSLCACREGAADIRRSLDEANRAISLGDYGRAQYIYYQLKQRFPNEQKIRLGLGYCYLKQNHDDYAAGEFSKALELSSQTNGLAWTGLGVYYQRLRKVGDAEICFKNALACLPDNRDAACHLGNLQFKGGRFEEAAETYKKVLNNGQNDGELYAVIGLCHQRAKNWREAVRYLEKARQELPKNKKLPLQLAHIYRENFDDPVKAADYFQKYALLDPQGARALRSSFQVPETKIEPEVPEKPEGSSAVTIVDKKEEEKKEVELSPGEKIKAQADTLEHDGRLKRLDGDFRGAIKAYSEALKLDPQRGYLHGEIGDLYASEFEDEELLNALRSYRAYADWCRKDSQSFEVANQKIKEVSTRYNQAEAKLRELRTKEEEEKKAAELAEKERKAALERDVNEKLARAKSYDQILAEGTKLIGEGKPQEAREALQKAVAMNENDYRAYYQIGLCVFMQISGKAGEAINKAKCEEAIQQFTLAIEKKGNYANSYGLRGIVYDMLGKEEEAMNDFSYYLEIVGMEDNSPLTRRILPRYDKLAGAR